MSLYNAILWLDQDEAFVFHFNCKESAESVVLSKHQRHTSHHPKHTGHGYNFDATSYFKSIEDALAEAREIVISGPSTMKFEFAKHLAQHYKRMSERVIAIEKSDHAGDSDILGLAKKYFKVPATMVHSSYIAGL